MTTEIGSGRDEQKAPRAVIPEGISERARQSLTVGRQHRVVLLGIELDALARLLRSRRFQERVIVGGIVLAALTRMAREDQARAWARLAAWDKRRNLRYRRGAKARAA